jgi:hypothetical protein
MGRAILYLALDKSYYALTPPSPISAGTMMVRYPVRINAQRNNKQV